MADTKGILYLSGTAGAAAAVSEKGVRLAQKMQVGPRIAVGVQLEKAEVGPTSGPTRRLSHLEDEAGDLQMGRL